MKILHIVHQYLPEYVGGTELYTQQVGRWQASQGHEVTIFVPTAVAGGTTWEDGVRIIRIATGKRGRGKVFFDSFGNRTIESAFASLLKNEQFDLVHIQHLMGIPVGMVDQLIAQNVPYVVTLHDYWYPCANAQLITNYDETICEGPDAKMHNCGRCFIARAGVGDIPLFSSAVAPLLRKRYERLRPILIHARAVIPPTQFVLDTYAEQGFSTDNFHLIRHGIQLPETILEPYEHDQFHVVFIGSIAWQKGVHILVEAFNQMDVSARLSIAGGLESFPEYAQSLQEMATHPHVDFLGRVPHEQIWELLASADCVVMPTLWYEASPLTIDEFFVAKAPIIASDIGAMTEKIRHGVDGLLFPVGDVQSLVDSLRLVQSQPSLLAQFRANIAPVRSVQIHLQELMGLYQVIQSN